MKIHQRKHLQSLNAKKLWLENIENNEAARNNFAVKQIKSEYNPSGNYFEVEEDQTGERFSSSCTYDSNEYKEEEDRSERHPATALNFSYNNVRYRKRSQPEKSEKKCHYELRCPISFRIRTPPSPNKKLYKSGSPPLVRKLNSTKRPDKSGASSMQPRLIRRYRYPAASYGPPRPPRAPCPYRPCSPPCGPPCVPGCVPPCVPTCVPPCIPPCVPPCPPYVPCCPPCSPCPPPCDPFDPCDPCDPCDECDDCCCLPRCACPCPRNRLFCNGDALVWPPHPMAGRGRRSWYCDPYAWMGRGICCDPYAISGLNTFDDFMCDFDLMNCGCSPFKGYEPECDDCSTELTNAFLAHQLRQIRVMKNRCRNINCYKKLHCMDVQLTELIDQALKKKKILGKKGSKKKKMGEGGSQTGSEFELDDLKKKIAKYKLKYEQLKESMGVSEKPAAEAKPEGTNDGMTE
ncbi:hypothetical protein HELRODRAFT_181803 [Helobdella robusta]|uniref:Uncharacterized protein n=1 Tax=Helobdella robusta TaxID=6412 RepID=T1FHC4_HELRO|nr:hypothetical protein HELRODRAFT_181803 [Helobdella robusta]ESN92027.1 hypothetical protein HELRODRAFT_181803 [Helobdella robusta]